MEYLFYTRNEIARLFKVSTDTIDRLAAKGHLKRHKIGARTVFYIPEVETFIAKLVREGAIDLA